MPQNHDAEHLARLQDHYARHRSMPPMAAIGELLGFRSTGAVFELVGRLKEAGYLRQGSDRRLAPTERFFERRILGTVRAGNPDAAPEEWAAGYNIDSALVEVPSRTCLLRVTGDSMKDAGILDGDFVVVRKNATARAGDIVVAIVDGAFTVKYLASSRGGGFFLRAASEGHADIRPRERLEIYGLVVGSFRKFDGK